MSQSFYANIFSEVALLLVNCGISYVWRDSLDKNSTSEWETGKEVTWGCVSTVLRKLIVYSSEIFFYCDWT